MLLEVTIKPLLYKERTVIILLLFFRFGVTSLALLFDFGILDFSIIFSFFFRLFDNFPPEFISSSNSLGQVAFCCPKIFIFETQVDLLLTCIRYAGESAGSILYRERHEIRCILKPKVTTC